MEISLTLLEEYFERTKYPINIKINLDDVDNPTLVFIVGKSPEGSRREYLTYRDLNDILTVNKVYSRLQIESDRREQQFREAAEGKREWRQIQDRSELIDKTFYETLMKYIYQLL